MLHIGMLHAMVQHAMVFVAYWGAACCTHRELQQGLGTQEVEVAIRAALRCHSALQRHQHDSSATISAQSMNTFYTSAPMQKLPDCKAGFYLPVLSWNGKTDRQTDTEPAWKQNTQLLPSSSVY